MKGYSQAKIEHLVDAVLEDDPYGDCWDAVQQLEEQPAETVVPAVVAALERATVRSAYQRMVWLLASHGTDEALDALVCEAYEQEDWTAIAIAALALSKHPSVDSTLLSLLSEGQPSYRRAATAYALANTRSSYAIAPLIRIAANKHDPLCQTAYRVLSRLGPPQDLVRRLLSDDLVSVAERVELFVAMHILYPSFDVLSYLKHLSRRALYGVQTQAAKAYALLAPRLTLLRSTDAMEDAELLRPARGTDNNDAAALLQPAWPPELAG